ncbi:prenyltransferase [Diaminobutyricimonas sp. TR449]|uniref:prenyltransferase n=1 Tax=Diaminobutyricimonas sp. TR449 TaxID=2708076 RepID=UPI001420D495|nr:prenyltransferase [Diaminobutyricimonas sp. TR449]
MTRDQRTRAHRPLAMHLLIASRPLSWINTAFGFAAAYLLTTGQMDATLIVGTLFFLVPYNLLMYGINDVFDYASDVANPRKGGLEGALLPPSVHRATLIASVSLALPFLGYLLIVGSPASWLVLAVSLFAVVAYSAPGLRFKERPFLDSLTSSTHFVSPAVYGLTLAGATLTPELLVVLTAFFLWGVASHAFGAVQDIVPDREARIGSIATALGARFTVRFAIVLWTAAGLLMLLTDWPGPLAAALAVPYIVAVAPFVWLDDDRSAEANRGWKRFLWINYAVGFCVTMLLIAFALQSP